MAVPQCTGQGTAYCPLGHYGWVKPFRQLEVDLTESNVTGCEGPDLLLVGGAQVVMKDHHGVTVL